MKDIKSFLIGFLSCACMFLLMGHGIHNSLIQGGNHSHTSDNVYDEVVEIKKETNKIDYIQDLVLDIWVEVCPPSSRHKY